MTTPGGPRAARGTNPMFPQVPRGETVAAYDSYEAALEGVDRLARNEGFTVEAISIVGSDLKSVERVTGRMSLWRAAANGAMSGVMLGLFVGAVFVLLDPAVNLAMMFGMLLLAIVFGALWGLLVYAISPNKREFTSVMQVTATRYEVVVPPNLAASARQILGAGGPGAGIGHLPGHGPADAVPPAPYVPDPLGGGPSSSTPAASEAGPAGAAPTNPTAAASAPPAGPPRTYGEMQDEQRRREREARAGDPPHPADE